MPGVASAAFLQRDRGELRRKLLSVGVGHAVAERIVQIPPGSRERLLYDPQLQQLVRSRRSMRQGLMRALIPPRGEVIPAPIAVPVTVQPAVHQESGLVLEQMIDVRGVVRLSIRESGSEIVAANVQGGRIDHTSLRLFGYRAWDMPNLPAHVRRPLAVKLYWLYRGRLLKVMADESLTGPGASFRIVAGLAGYVGSLAGAPFVVIEPPVGPDPVEPIDPPVSVEPSGDCTESNGCGPEVDFLEQMIPDGYWKVCCDEHDRCYCLGDCNSCGRLQCDDTFLKCMVNRAGLPIGYVYYLFVRGFGGFGSYECDDDPFGVGGLVAIAAGALIGIIIAAMTGSPLAGFSGGALSAALLALALCNICEPIYNFREWLEETIDELTSWRRVRQAIHKCRRQPGWWRRAWCRLKVAVQYFFKWVLAIVLAILWVVLRALELVTCG